MSATNELNRIIAILGTVGVGILAWVGAQFGNLPNRVTTLETKAVMEASRLDRMENKLDKIFEAVKK